MGKYVIALDEGTTSTRCILFDREGRICSVGQKEFDQIYPNPGWVEHDPEEIWLCVMEVAREAMAKAKATAQDIAAIGITNQRETTVVWDKNTGEPVYHAICWQCRRTADRIARMKEDGIFEYARQTTGLVPDAYFSASKIEWILDNVPGAREKAQAGELLAGTIDTWMIWKLTGGKCHITDYTNASRTMLFDIRKLCWDKKLIEYFNIPENMLPKALPSSRIYGYTGLFGGSIPVAGAAGDQQAALFGQCGFVPGVVKNTYGTGGFMLMNTGQDAVDSHEGLITTIAACAEGKPIQYAVEGSVFIAGAAIQWLRDELKMIDNAADTEWICRSAQDTEGVYIVPAFSGLGAPYWNPYARGMMTGLTRGASRKHIVRAVVESMAYQTNDLLKCMRKESGLDINVLRVDGGASANDFLMQIQADISDVQIQRPECIETTALGAAYLAGLAVGFWKDENDISENWKCEKVFNPEIAPEKRKELAGGWDRAVRCALAWADLN